MTEEERIHKAILAYLRLILPGALIHHSPNEGVRGGKAGAIDGARRKAMGMHKGFPDLMIKHEGRVYYLEVKAEGKPLQPKQREFRAFCAEWGHPYAVVRSVDDVRETLAEWGVETREAS